MDGYTNAMAHTIFKEFCGGRGFATVNCLYSSAEYSTYPLGLTRYNVSVYTCKLFIVL